VFRVDEVGPIDRPTMDETTEDTFRKDEEGDREESAAALPAPAGISTKGKDVASNTFRRGLANLKHRSLPSFPPS